MHHLGTICLYSLLTGICRLSSPLNPEEQVEMTDGQGLQFAANTTVATLPLRPACYLTAINLLPVEIHVDIFGLAAPFRTPDVPLQQGP